MSDKPLSKSRKPFGFLDFVWRWVGAILLVLITYNPTGHSYIHWVREAFSSDGLGAVHFLVGILLVAGWTAFLVATRNSLGSLGMLIGAALVGTTMWLLADIGLVKADSMSALIWLVLFAVATLLAIGMSWSHIWRRLSGQLEVDDNS